MAWVKVPPENHPKFHAALPDDKRVETMKMFGGVAAKVNGHIFAGLFGRSTMVYLAEPERARALALPGAAPFDPMGDGRARSDKVMLPESLMDDAEGLSGWIARAFEGAAALPPKTKKKEKEKAEPKRRAATPGGSTQAKKKTKIGRRKPR